MSMLSKFILATVVYYDTLEYPLTAFEIWKHLLIPDGESLLPRTSLAAIEQSLEGLRRDVRLVVQDGFWVLPDRLGLIQSRIQREKQAVQKLKRAATLIRWCAWIPYVRMIALTGSLSMKQGDRMSDWDFLVILKGGAIWTGRFFLTAWLTLLRSRRHDSRVADRACLNCYLTDTSLEVPLRDVFSSHEYRFLYPVIGEDVFRAFELANRWIVRYRPHFLPTETAPFFLSTQKSWSYRVQSALEGIVPLNWLESFLRNYQKQRIEQNPKTHIPNGFILASDEALIFLPDPKGPRIFEVFKDKLSKLLV